MAAYPPVGDIIRETSLGLSHAAFNYYFEQNKPQAGLCIFTAGVVMCGLLGE